MSIIPGHILKFKNENGEWIDIPLLVINVYDAYVNYCTERNIKPVSQETYYTTLGELKTLTEQLGNSTEAIQTLAAALGEKKSLPLSLGGTGHSFNTEPDFIDYLTEAGLVDDTRMGTAEKNITNLFNSKLDITAISYDTDPPTPTTTGLLYFQI